MKSCYVDIHIHTSNDANSLVACDENGNKTNKIIDNGYDIDLLVNNILKISKDNPFLISLTDHNVINTKVYLKLIDKKVKFLVGVEAHVRVYDDCDYYHCHLLFNLNEETLNDKEKLETELDNINEILLKLYPDKLPSNSDSIPTIHEIINSFYNYNLLILPHGGQSHRTFDGAIKNKKDIKFDSFLERSIYYNLFDGFTSRSNKGTDDTIAYFKRLGINEFINLLTCTDNYEPAKYPNSKGGECDFIPTWMNSEPTFNGLRLALSENSRLHYDKEPENILETQDKIDSIYLENNKIKIDVSLQSGLNVVIGNSSSGKSLFVDLLYNKINNTLNECKYNNSFDLKDVKIVNNSGMSPHYFDQNYISKIINPSLDGKTNCLDNNELLCKIFPFDTNIKNEIEIKLNSLKMTISDLFDSVKEIESIKEEFSKIPYFYNLISEDIFNVFSAFKISEGETTKIEDSKNEKSKVYALLESLSESSNKICFCESITKEIESIKIKLDNAFKEIEFSESVNSLINEKIKNEDELLYSNKNNVKKIKEQKDSLFLKINSYVRQNEIFKSSLNKLISFNFENKTKEIKSAGHSLYIENNFKISNDKIIEIFNSFLKNINKLDNLSSLEPSKLFISNFNLNKCKNYEDLKTKVYNSFKDENKILYKIKYKEQKDFDLLSPGLKSSVILDIILGYDGDNAPLIIDQPEDNLATSYINHDLIKAIKKCKSNRQIIIVSHNATIPMLGDAQNIIFCENINGFVTIKSYRMEDDYNGNKTVLDIIAEVTDGGKTSIKKRFKKYNMKSYKGENENENQND